MPKPSTTQRKRSPVYCPHYKNHNPHPEYRPKLPSEWLSRMKSANKKAATQKPKTRKNRKNRK